MQKNQVPKATITPESLILPEWELCREGALRIELLPNLPTSGVYETVPAASIVHAYLPTTLITDKATAFGEYG